MRRNQLRPRAQKPVGVPRSWYGIRNSAGGMQVTIYAEIGGFGITADQFCKDLSGLDTQELAVRINSPGGDVFDGIAIHNALANHPAKVHVTVDGVAASIASVIAMAGDKVTMSRGSQMMIHEGHTVAVGNAADMLKQSKLLDTVSDTIAGFYAERAGGSVAQWRDRMRKETWYNADEAVAAGLADEVAVPSRQVKATWDLSIFNYAGRAAAPAPDLEVFNHPGHPDQSSHGRRRKKIDLPDAPAVEKPAPAAPKKTAPKRRSPAKTAAPRRDEPAPVPAKKKRVPRFHRMTDDEVEEFFIELTPQDWNSFSEPEKDRVHDWADKEWEDNGNPNLQELVALVEKQAKAKPGNSAMSLPSRTPPPAPEPVLATTSADSILSQLLTTPSTDSVLNALLKGK